MIVRSLINSDCGVEGTTFAPTPSSRTSFGAFFGEDSWTSFVEGSAGKFEEGELSRFSSRRVF
jgi:hypothetical protein